MMLKKKLVGSTGSPLGRASVRCEGGGVMYLKDAFD